MITKINESKALINLTSCNCRCTFDGRKCNVNQQRNVYVSYKKPIKHQVCKN